MLKVYTVDINAKKSLFCILKYTVTVNLILEINYKGISFRYYVIYRTFKPNSFSISYFNSSFKICFNI